MDRGSPLLHGEMGCLVKFTHPSPLRPSALSLGDGSSALSKIVRILNNNLQSLALIDARTDEVQERLKEIKATPKA